MWHLKQGKTHSTLDLASVLAQSVKLNGYGVKTNVVRTLHVMAQSLQHLLDRSRQNMNWGALSGNRAAADEQLRMIWSHARLGVFVATAFAFALGLTLRGVVAPFAVMDTWLAAKLAIALFRWMQGWQFHRVPSTDHGWGYLTLTALVVDATVWGMAGLYVALSAPWPVASFVIAVLACISCVATFGLQASALYTAAYSVPILAPTALGMFMRGEALGELGGLGLLMLLGLQIATAVRSERRLMEAIRLRIQAEALAKEKEEALKTAMRQSAVKTQFLANMSHELRTPLHGILGMARLLHMDVHEPLLARRVELIQSSGTHLLGLINDLLDISRIEAGQFMLRSERYDLRAQVEQLVGVYAVRAEDKGLFFDVHHQLPPQCWVMGDPARFRQVLHNLLGNAIKFTQRGGIALTIERDDERGLVRAEVRDTGVGIARQDIDKIFKAFQQSDSGTSAGSTEGVGLGLTIARDIARAMGGDITADSEQGVGSTMVFTARLPSAHATSTAQQPVATPAKTGSPSRTDTQTQPVASPARHCLVLMAEDNDVNALVATDYLDVIGADTERVKDGREAVRHALRETNRPDIVLMDCHMPVMNGYEATRMIRAQETKLGLAHVPIIALTATASDAERQDCLDAGMDDFLSKPCSLEEMTSMLERWTPNEVKRPDADAQQHDAVPVESVASPGASFQT